MEVIYFEAWNFVRQSDSLPEQYREAAERWGNSDFGSYCEVLRLVLSAQKLFSLQKRRLDSSEGLSRFSENVGSLSRKVESSEECFILAWSDPKDESFT